MKSNCFIQKLYAILLRIRTLEYKPKIPFSCVIMLVSCYNCIICIFYSPISYPTIFTFSFYHFLLSFSIPLILGFTRNVSYFFYHLVFSLLIFFSFRFLFSSFKALFSIYFIFYAFLSFMLFVSIFSFSLSFSTIVFQTYE